MYGRFGEAASRLSGIAAMLLGWRPDEFWAATPAELAVALEQPSVGAEPPDLGTIEELKRRFPDSQD